MRRTPLRDRRFLGKGNLVRGEERETQHEEAGSDPGREVSESVSRGRAKKGPLQADAANKPAVPACDDEELVGLSDVLGGHVEACRERGNGS